MIPNSELYSRAYRALSGSRLHALATVFIVLMLQGIAGSVYVGIVVLGALSIGQYMYFLHLSRTQMHPPLETIFEGFKPSDRFIQSLIAIILVTLLVMLGTLLLVIPGIIAGIGLSMTFFIMADHPGIRATDAMRRSWEMVWERGNFWKVLGFQLLAIPLFLPVTILLFVYIFLFSPIWYGALAELLFLLGTILLFVGIFLVLPIYYTALAGLYDTLNGD